MKKDKEFHTVRGYQMLNAENKLLTPSMEDYVEMLYRNHLKDGFSRVNHLSKSLNVRPSSTSKVLQKLKNLGLVQYEKYGVIKLTTEGKNIGRFLLKRHEIIDAFLTNIGLQDALLKDIEMIEHDVSLSTLKNIYILNKFFLDYPDILKKYKEYQSLFSENLDLNYFIE